MLHSSRLEALAHVRTTAGKQVAHALAFAPVEEIERATLSLIGTPAKPGGMLMAAAGGAVAGGGLTLQFAGGGSRHETM